MSSALRFTNPLIALSALAVLAACGSPTPVSSQSALSPTPVSSQSALTAADIDAAKAAALTLFVKVDSNFWTACPSANDFAACPLSTAVRERLAALVESNYFYSGPGGHCGGDFISNSTNGLQTEPKVVSAVADAGRHVTVVIERANTRIPELTAIMSKEGDRWLATDLASGSGPNASIFAASPNC